MWEIEANTAQEIGDGLSTISSKIKNLPLIHFGTISFEQNINFVAGGTSRVYFGTCGKKLVAVKMLFAMELTPDVVKDFYSEVQILNTLQHRNVVSCYGISVMPPSICLVMEHCIYGSLFDYLHKKRPGRQVSTESSTSSTYLSSIVSEIRSRISSYTTTKSPIQQQFAETSMSKVLSPMIQEESETESTVVRETASTVERFDSESNDHFDIDNYMVPNRSSFPNRTSLISSTTSRSSQNSNISEKDIRESFRQSMTRRERGLSMNQRLKQKLTVGNLAHHTEVNSAPHFTTTTTVSQLSQGGESVQKPSFYFKEKLRMMRDVVSGILFLHEQGFIHCDIKSPNFLVSEVSEFYIIIIINNNKKMLI